MQDLPDLRQFAEELISTAPIYQYPRNEALIHSYRLIQALQTVNLIGGILRGVSVPGYRSMRGTQDILRWLTYQVFRNCPEGGRTNLSTLESDKQPVWESLNRFGLFSELQDAIMSVAGGFYKLEVSESGTRVRFLDNPAAPLRWRRTLAEHLDRKGKMARELVRERQLDPNGARFKTIKVAADGKAFDYRFTGGLRRVLCRDLNSPEFSLPGELSLGAYSIDDFSLLWDHLVCRLHIREFALEFVSKQEWDFKWTAHNSAALIVDRERLIGEIAYHQSLRKSVVREIVKDLTYNRDLTRDVMYQPLVPLGKNSLITIPALITGANPERNLLALLDRLPWRSDGARAAKDVREGIMIEDIISCGNSLDLDSLERVKLRQSGSNDLVGEVDLILWRNGDSSYALLISLKWFYGADSMQEVINHDGWFKEGLAKHFKHVEYVAENATELGTRYPKLPSWSASTEFGGLLVSKMYTPSELVTNEVIPVVTLERFLKGLVECQGDLRLVQQEMLAVAKGADYPTAEFEPTEQKFEHDGIVFSFPAVRVASGH